jgi:hypothetical protein
MYLNQMFDHLTSTLASVLLLQGQLWEPCWQVMKINEEAVVEVTKDFATLLYF